MLWQKLMIKLATNPRAKQMMQGSRKMTDFYNKTKSKHKKWPQ